jgi:hypothetical protein
VPRATASGVAVTQAGDRALVGAFGQDDLGADSGSAYHLPTACPTGPIVAFCFGDGTEVTPCPCGNFGFSGRGCANSQNVQGALLHGSGSVSPDAVTLTASGVLPIALTIFLQGDQTIPGAAVFGDGLRCTGGALLRLYVESAVNGTISVPQPGDPTITQRSAQLGDFLFPGSTRLYQAYYRDPDLGFCPAPPGNSWNVTSAVRISW